MKKAISICLTIILCLINFSIIFYLIDKNENNVFELVKNNQAKSLYQVSINSIDFEDAESLTAYIKTLKVSSNENWYIYDNTNKNFILYKDKSNQKIDDSVKNFFLSYTEHTKPEVISCADGNEIVLSIKEVKINEESYLVGISEYTTAILNSVNNHSFNVYIYGETIVLSLLCLILIISLGVADSEHKNKYNKLVHEFNDYKSRFIEGKVVEPEQVSNIQNAKSQPQPIQNEDGEYTPYFLELILPKLEKDNILYNIYNVSELRFWIIEDYMKENVYKIRKDSEYFIILLINGTEKQKKLLEEFDE